jgi:hypothetical protein
MRVGSVDYFSVSSTSENSRETLSMQKRIASSLAAMGMAAAIVLPSAYVAQGRSDRAERPAFSISQWVDHADAGSYAGIWVTG